MTRRRTSVRLLLGLGLPIALAVGLGACGKRGAPHAPEGQEDAYVYPRFYPAPGKGQLLFGGAPAATEPKAEQKKKRKSRVPGETREPRRRPFGDEPEFDPLSSDDSTIGTYETSPQ